MASLVRERSTAPSRAFFFFRSFFRLRLFGCWQRLELGDGMGFEPRRLCQVKLFTGVAWHLALDITSDVPPSLFG